MGIREEELARAGLGGVSNAEALRQRMPAAGLAATVAERAPYTEAGRTRAAFNTQPGAAISEAATARMGPPTPSGVRINAQQPGAALAEAINARSQASPMMAAAPRTSYLLGGDAAGVPASTGAPQQAYLLTQPNGSARAAAMAPSPATPAAVEGGAAVRAALNQQPGEALAQAGAGSARSAAMAPMAPVAPGEGGALTRAAFSQPPGSAVANAAGGRSPMQGPPVPRPVSPPLTPAQLPGTAQWPNPNTGGAGALSREAMEWQAGRQALAGPTQSGVPLSPAATADRAGAAARLRGMLGLGANATAGVPPPPNLPPGAPPAAAAPGQPGPIGRVAAQAGNAAGQVLGTREAWGDWAANSKTVANLGKVARGVGTVAKFAAVPIGAAETYQGIKEGDMAKAGVGALDTAAGAALFTPAAPAAGAYLAVRGGYQAGQMLPEGVRDTIGSGINKVANLFGGGVDQATADNYARMNAEYAARQAAAGKPATAAAITSKSPAGGGNKAVKSPPTPASDAPPPSTGQTPPSAASRGRAAPAQDDGLRAALTERYTALQAAQEASPIARAVLGGAQSAIYYKDGTVHNLVPGEALPDAAQQFLAIGNAMSQIESGQYRPPAPDAPAVAGAPAGGGSSNPKVAAFLQQYGAAAQALGQQMGVDPSLPLAQFALESDWGSKVIPGTHNLGNIKSFSGKGVAATDNMTGSRDKYMQFDSPEAFMTHFGGMMQRKYPGTLGVGNDMARYAQGLKGYAEDPEYANKLMAIHRMMGPITASSSTPMGSPAVVTLDDEAPGAPAVAPAAGRAPYDPAPVQILRGLQDSTALPNAGGAGYTEVPTSVYQAGLRSGNAGLSGRGPIADFAASQMEGANFAVNPTGGKLAEQALQNAGNERVAQLGLQGRREEAAAARYKAELDADSAKKAIFNVMEETGQVDPYSNLPIRVAVPHRINPDTGKPERLAPEAVTPAVPGDAAIAALVADASPQRQAEFDRHFKSPGLAKRVLEQHKKGQ